MDKSKKTGRTENGMTNPEIPQAATILNASTKERAKAKHTMKGSDANEGLNDSTQCSI